MVPTMVGLINCNVVYIINIVLRLRWIMRNGICKMLCVHWIQFASIIVEQLWILEKLDVITAILLCVHTWLVIHRVQTGLIRSWLRLG